MIEVRELAAGEEQAVLHLARMMHQESPVYSPHPFEHDVLLGWIAMCRDNEDWLCLIAWDDGEPIGFIAVGCVPMLFSTARTVDDLGLFVIPEKRGTTAALRLLRNMEPWAVARGARTIRMGVTTGTNEAQAVKFFERFGYRKTGTLLTKTI